MVQILRLGKRGVTLRAIITLVIIALLLFLFPLVGKTFGKQLIFNKVYTTKDLALLVNAIYLVPGNVIVAYNSSTSDFDFSFRENKVSAYTGSVIDPTKASHWYVDVIDNPLDITLEQPEMIFLKKINKKLEIDDEYASAVGLYMVCPEVKVGIAMNQVSLVIDPAGNSGDEKEEEDIFKKDLVTYSIADFVRKSPELKFSSKTLTRGKDSDKTEDERLEQIKKDTGLVLSITAGRYDKDEQPVRIFIPADEDRLAQNRRMACLIINQLVDDDELRGLITSTEIIPYDFPLLTKNDMENRLALIASIGNLRTDENLNILSSHDRISKAIIRAIKEYYRIKDGE